MLLLCSRCVLLLLITCLLAYLPADEAKGRDSKSKKGREDVSAGSSKRPSIEALGKALRVVLGPELGILEGEWNKTRTDLQQGLDGVEAGVRGELERAKRQAEQQTRLWKQSADAQVQQLLNQWLSDDGLKTTFSAYNYWRGVAEGARLKRLCKDLGLSDAIAARAAAALNAKIPPKALTAMAVATNVTAEIVADTVEAPRNAGASAAEVMAELIEWAEDVDAALNSMVATKAMDALVPKEYRAVAHHMVAMRAAPRLLLASAAALLHGFDVREDLLLHALVAAYTFEQATQGMAVAVLAALDEVVGDGSSDATHDKRHWQDGGLQGLLEACTAGESQPSCQEIGESAFDFFQDLAVKTRPKGTPDAGSEDDTPKGMSKGTSKDTSMATSIPALGAAAAAAPPQPRRRFPGPRRRGNAPPKSPLVAVIRRNEHLTPAARVALNMARVMRAQGRARRKEARARARGMYQWGGMFAMPPPDEEGSSGRNGARLSEVDAGKGGGEGEGEGGARDKRYWLRLGRRAYRECHVEMEEGDALSGDAGGDGALTQSGD
ncbi:hypothetical protein JKP88DRAFT_348904 [Tribonema minus]|uniref:Uncharacterized protein n=1 Tax=Tribonema minus TaxID=303371 RepID=A0A836CG08_9STRA|nr:hypothetical protein JKP88DRAFT_348904 [Tribonema minus]